MEGVGQEQVSEARESSRGPGKGPLQLLASLLFTGANAMSLPYASLDVVRSEEMERHFTFFQWEKSPAHQQGWPSLQTWSFQFHCLSSGVLAWIWHEGKRKPRRAWVTGQGRRESC